MLEVCYLKKLRKKVCVYATMAGVPVVMKH